MKTKAEKSLDQITRNGKTGYFVPATMFNKDNCIIIVNADSENKQTVNDIITKGDNIRIYSARTSKRTSSKRIHLKPVRNSSSLFKSLSRSLNQVTKHRVEGTRPKSFEEFLDEL
jgi:hypothetical protein